LPSPHDDGLFVIEEDAGLIGFMANLGGEVGVDMGV
jgi:hypothetical protein